MKDRTLDTLARMKNEAITDAFGVWIDQAELNQPLADTEHHGRLV